MNDRPTSNDNARDFKVPEHNPVGDAIAKAVLDMCDDYAKKHGATVLDDAHPLPPVLKEVANNKYREPEKFLPVLTIHH